MICFEVRVNGRLLCTAGAGDNGVLSAILTWVKRQAEACPEGEDEEWHGEVLDLSVGGITHEGEKSEHVTWLKRDLKPGDKVSVHVVERDTCDPPEDRSSVEPYQGQNTFSEPNDAVVAYRSRHVEPQSGRPYEVRLSAILAGEDPYDDAVDVEVAFEDGARHIATFFRDPQKGRGPRGRFFADIDDMILVAELAPELMVEAATGLVGRGDLERAFRRVSEGKG